MRVNEGRDDRRTSGGGDVDVEEKVGGLLNVKALGNSEFRTPSIILRWGDGRNRAAGKGLLYCIFVKATVSGHFQAETPNLP